MFTIQQSVVFCARSISFFGVTLGELSVFPFRVKIACQLTFENFEHRQWIFLRQLKHKPKHKHKYNYCIEYLWFEWEPSLEAIYKNVEFPIISRLLICTLSHQIESHLFSRMCQMWKLCTTRLFKILFQVALCITKWGMWTWITNDVIY